MRCAILMITPEVLSAMLQLPEGAEVVAVNHCDRRGVLEIVVHGAGWDIPLGAAIVRAPGICRTQSERLAFAPPSPVEIDWGFPAEEKQP